VIVEPATGEVLDIPRGQYFATDDRRARYDKGRHFKALRTAARDLLLRSLLLAGEGRTDEALEDALEGL